MEEMAIIFYNTRLLLLDIHENFALVDPVCVYAVGYLDVVIRGITAYLRERKQKKVAFVTHFSAVLPRGILTEYPIFVVKEDPEHGIRQYHELFKSLVGHGYSHVVALMPHAEYWMSYHHAKHAAHKLEHEVSVIDTQLFGLGLGLLLQELCPRVMKVLSVKELLSLTVHLAKSIEYWIVPLTPVSMKNQLWYQKMNRQFGIHDSGWESQIPLISLSHQSAILSRSKTPTDALLNLQAVVRSGTIVPLKLIIENHGLLQEASTIGRYFQKQFPICEMTLAATSLNLGNEWGFFIGVAVLYPSPKVC